MSTVCVSKQQVRNLAVYFARHWQSLTCHNSESVFRSDWRRLARYILTGHHLALYSATDDERAADLARVFGWFNEHTYKTSWLAVAQYVWRQGWPADLETDPPA